MEIREMIELMRAVSEYSLTSFELKQGDLCLAVRKEAAHAYEAPDNASAVPAAGVPDAMVCSDAGIDAVPREADTGKAQSFEEVSSDQIITCPLVGTFYSSPAPDAEDFVKAGDTVKKGQVVGIVEAMKLMNEIESEYDGTVEAVLVKNGEIVEYGQPLFRIR